MSQATRKSRYDDVYHEIAQYQQIIDSLRAEVSEYKSNLGNILSDNIQYEQVIESLVDEVTEYKSKLGLISSEIAQYKNKLDSVISERAQKKNTELPRQEVYEDKNTHAQTSSGAAQDELILHSLGTDIAKLKKDLESITVEV